VESQDRAEPLLRLRGVSKRFGHTQALADVDLEVHTSESVAVLGENGAGKSTLMKILAGVYKPDAGELFFAGKPYTPSSPADANHHGIVMVHQEPTFLPHLTVLQNLFAGRELTGPLGGIRWRAMRDEARELFRDVGLEAGLLDRRMGTLSLGEQQLVLIARAFHHDAKLLILDEPTSILTATESERLFALVQRWLEHGAVLYITHRSRELEEVAHRAIVLRDGRRVGELEVDGDIEDDVVRLMSGRDRDTLAAIASEHDRSPVEREVALRIDGLSVPGILHDISLELHRGEVLGLYGLVGAGRTEVALSLLGELPSSGGTIELLGEPYTPSTMAHALERRLAYVPEDRKTMGIFPYLSVRENLAAAELGRRGGPAAVIDRDAERELTGRYIEELDIKTASMDDRITTLSGGSQQKVILGRWLATDPQVLVLDEPTRGIDVTTKSEIHRLIASLAQAGLAVLLISSELPELLALSDRVLVLREGRVVLELSDGELDEEAVLRAALGSRNDSQERPPASGEAGEASAAGPGRIDDAAR
jgi:rhamnose transport system ATP-binding protein